ncbi:MAG: DEAD/DEAH box helicase [Patescibacteria group bacterium]|nr:DEAD/DEAH box helicase [Patescibacteria group bacterium]
MTPMATQLSGAEFLAGRKTALLADEPRVGKTGAALLAVEMVDAQKILIVTTTSGRAVWRKAIKDWILGAGQDFVIVSWDSLRNAKTYGELSRQSFDLAILDEDHRAKNPETKTAQAIYGRFDRQGRRLSNGLSARADRVWHLTGTPLPHDPGDMWCRLRNSMPELLAQGKELPDVTAFEDFRARYCVVRMKQISNFRSIPVVIGGRNLPELRTRLGDWMLRRTQKDVGIRPPVRELMPLAISAAQRKELATDISVESVVSAIEQGRTKDLEMELGTLRRLTGRIKAEAVVSAAKEWLDDNPGDKLVLAYFHREVGDILEDGLKDCCRVDGSTSPTDRAAQQEVFRSSGDHRIFLAQIDACGEAIDLSAAPELWFVEAVFSPKSMLQMSHRISNVGQTKNTFIKVAMIEGSIDEAIQASLLRLWTSIKEVING